MNASPINTASGDSLEENNGPPADGFYRLWSENEAYFVTVVGDLVKFRGRNFTQSVAECLANGDRFELVTSAGKTEGVGP